MIKQVREAFRRQTGQLERKGQLLHCYSSGSGSLSYCWSIHSDRHPGGEASGRKVTKGQVLCHLEMKANRHLWDKGWRPVCINGRWQLARRIERVSRNRLRITDGDTAGVYSYKIDKRSIWWRKYKEVQHPNLTVTFLRDGERYEVKNESILMVIRFFLNYEAELAEPFSYGYQHYGR
jgi:hypothetical protein